MDGDKRAASAAHHGEGAWGQRGTAGASFAGELTFENVRFSARRREIVRGVSFSVQPGEIVCLLGPSGCGKTTLLRLAAGVLRAGSGRILLDGQDIDGPQRFLQPEHRNLGLVFQDFALFPHLTALQNIAFGLHKLPKAEALKIASLVLERVGLAHHRDTYPGTLSGGEQQRVALARAIAPRPKVMLLDEPFSGLDQRLRESVRGETLALLKETQASCVLVTHDPVEALEFADRIMLMRQGCLVQIGRPVELFEQPADLETARFFSEASEFCATSRNGHLETPLGRIPLRDKAHAVALGKHSQEWTVFLRPEALTLANPGDKGVDGLVLERRYLGERTRLVLQFAGLEQPVAALITGSGPQRGQTARFKLDDRRVLTFARDGLAPT